MSRPLTIIIIVLALAGATVLGYRVWFPSSSAPAVVEPGSGGTILPLGTNLNFETVRKYNKDGHTFLYPQVSPGEIGPALGDIIKQPSTQ